MPELPEVEVLVRCLAPLIRGKTIREVSVRRAKVVAPTQPKMLEQQLLGATFQQLTRRGKFLCFSLRRGRERFRCIGHLGMTGRMFLLPRAAVEPKHAAVVLGLGRLKFIFEDTRYFGRFTLDTRAVEVLGPEPLGPEFSEEYFAKVLQRSTQPVKVKLLDQCLVAGVGNIYASEALYQAGISPRLAARRLNRAQVRALHASIRAVLREAIDLGSTVPLDWAGTAARDRLFYFGRAENAPNYYEERLRVYDREGKTCTECGRGIRRLWQAGRSTFFCPGCQKSR